MESCSAALRALHFQLAAVSSRLAESKGRAHQKGGPTTNSHRRVEPNSSFCIRQVNRRHDGAKSRLLLGNIGLQKRACCDRASRKKNLPVQGPSAAAFLRRSSGRTNLAMPWSWSVDVAASRSSEELTSLTVKKNQPGH